MTLGERIKKLRTKRGFQSQPFQHVSDLAKLVPHLREPPYYA